MASRTAVATPENQYGELLDTYGNEFKVPDFTIKQIRDAIPAHCFQRSALRGFAYIARDIVLLASTFYLFNTYVTPENVPLYPLRFASWTLYTILQGLFGTGLWVIAHECGHQSFSSSKTLNDTTGWVLHSALLVPYFSWKISHGKHHKHTAHMERDMVFLPKTRSVYANRVRKAVNEISELAEEAPIMTAAVLIGRQLIGWPAYLIMNQTGHDNHAEQKEGRGKRKKNGLGGGINHFSPQSPLYDEKDAKYIALSDLGLGLMVIVLYELAKAYGWNNLLVWYFVPYLWVNHWLGTSSSSLQYYATLEDRKLMMCSGNHVPSTHRSNPRPLRPQNLDLHPRRRLHNRSRFRFHRAALISWHHRNSRPPPLRLDHPLLQRRRSQRSH